MVVLVVVVSEVVVVVLVVVVSEVVVVVLVLVVVLSCDDSFIVIRPSCVSKTTSSKSTLNVDFWFTDTLIDVSVASLSKTLKVNTASVPFPVLFSEERSSQFSV